MRSKVLQSYKELANLLEGFDGIYSTPPLVMIQVNPSDWHSVDEITKYENSLTIINEHLSQPEGVISVITSDGRMLSESQITI